MSRFSPVSMRYFTMLRNGVMPIPPAMSTSGMVASRGSTKSPESSAATIRAPGSAKSETGPLISEKMSAVITVDSKLPSRMPRSRASLRR